MLTASAGTSDRVGTPTRCARCARRCLGRVRIRRLTGWRDSLLAVSLSGSLPVTAPRANLCCHACARAGSRRGVWPCDVRPPSADVGGVGAAAALWLLRAGCAGCPGVCVATSCSARGGSVHAPRPAAGRHGNSGSLFLLRVCLRLKPACCPPLRSVRPRRESARRRCADQAPSMSESEQAW